MWLRELLVVSALIAGHGRAVANKKFATFEDAVTRIHDWIRRGGRVDRYFSMSPQTEDHEHELYAAAVARAEQKRDEFRRKLLEDENEMHETVVGRLSGVDQQRTESIHAQIRKRFKKIEDLLLKEYERRLDELTDAHLERVHKFESEDDGWPSGTVREIPDFVEDGDRCRIEDVHGTCNPS